MTLRITSTALNYFKLEENAMSFVLGVLAGFITTVLLWLFKNNFFPPNIEFGEDISKVINHDGKNKYVFIFKNKGHRRLIDITVKAVIRVPGIVPWDSNLTQTFYAKTTADNKFILDTSIPITASILLEISEDIFDSHLLPDNIKELIINRDRTLENLFSLHSDSCVKIYILGNDQVTGVRKVFESKEYFINDIKTGVFDRVKMVVTTTTT